MCGLCTQALVSGFNFALALDLSKFKNDMGRGALETRACRSGVEQKSLVAIRFSLVK